MILLNIPLNTEIDVLLKKIVGMNPNTRIFSTNMADVLDVDRVKVNRWCDEFDGVSDQKAYNRILDQQTALFVLTKTLLDRMQ